jgi:KDO2-lipid IV(A) lauroyltransferase
MIYHSPLNSSLAKKNLRFFFPHLSEKEILHLNKRFINNSVKNIIDITKINQYRASYNQDPNHEFRLYGFERITQYLKNKKSIIIATGHIGNFMMAFGMAPLFFKKQTYAILDVESTPEMRQNLKRRLELPNSKLIRRKRWRDVYDYLENNSVVILACDQAMGNNSVTYVDFFGRKYAFPVGPALISYKTGVPVFPGFFVREKSKYSCYIQPSIIPDKNLTLDENIPIMMQKFANVHEKFIRKYPDQYFWRLRI